MNIEIDVEQFARDIKAGKSIGGKDGALGSLIKQLTEATPKSDGWVLIYMMDLSMHIEKDIL